MDTYNFTVEPQELLIICLRFPKRSKGNLLSWAKSSFGGAKTAHFSSHQNLYVASVFYMFVFWPQGTWDLRILATLPGNKPATPALEGKVLTTVLPGKSHCYYGYCCPSLGLGVPYGAEL